MRQRQIITKAPIELPSRSSALRITKLFDERYLGMVVKVDNLLARLMIAQWIAGIAIAFLISPLAWAGKEAVLHSHVFAAIFVGGAITSLPVFLVYRAPGSQLTRYVLAIAQVLWSALLIHLSGGRIETHFHVFVSLSLLAFYRDIKILIPATLVVALDHFARGLYWPESVYGVLNPEWWRFLEHAGWVMFLDGFLLYQCVYSYRELHSHCEQQVALEDAIDSAGKMEKLAAIGTLAASVGHELRNPLGAIRNAHTYIERKLNGEELAPLDPKLVQFFAIITRELDVSSKIINDLLEFSRPREPDLAPCPLRPLVEESMSLVPPRDGVTLVNDVPESLPIPDVDRDQFRQVLINIIQNASEAYKPESTGEVRVAAKTTERQGWQIIISDNGGGIAPDIIDKIFEPLFSTKVKGTGLGLALTSSMIERHEGSIDVDSTEGQGCMFTIQLPPRSTGGAS